MSDLNTIGTSQAATPLNEHFESADGDALPKTPKASFHDLFSKITTNANSQPNTDSLDAKDTAPTEELPDSTEKADQPGPSFNDSKDVLDSMESGAENNTSSLTGEVSASSHSKNRRSSQNVSETSGKPINGVSLTTDRHPPESAGFAHRKSVVQEPSNANKVQIGSSETGRSTQNLTAVISKKRAGLKHAHRTPDLLNRREPRTTVLKNGQAKPPEPVRHTPESQPHDLLVQAKTIFEPTRAPLRITGETVPRPSNAITRAEHTFWKTALPAVLKNSGTKSADQLASILPAVADQKTIKTSVRTPLASGDLEPESGVKRFRLDRKIALTRQAAPNDPATDQHNIPVANTVGVLKPFEAPTGSKQDQTPMQILPLESLARQRKLVHPAQTGMPVEKTAKMSKGPIPEGPKTQFGPKASINERREWLQNYDARDIHQASEKSTLQTTEYQKPLPTSDTPPHAGREIDLEQRLAFDGQKKFNVSDKHPGIVRGSLFQVVPNAFVQPGMTALGSDTQAQSPEPTIKRLPTQDQFETLLARPVRPTPSEMRFQEYEKVVDSQTIKLARFSAVQQHATSMPSKQQDSSVLPQSSGSLDNGTRRTPPAETDADNMRNPIALETIHLAIRTVTRGEQNRAEPLVLHRTAMEDIGARRIDASTTDKSVQLNPDQENSTHTKPLASPEPIRMPSGARPDKVAEAFEISKPGRPATDHQAVATERNFQAVQPEIVSLSNNKTQIPISSLATTGLFDLSMEISNVIALEKLTVNQPGSSVPSLQPSAVHPSAVIGAVPGPYPLPLAQVVEALPSRAGQHVEIILRPEELGQVRMTLSATEGGMVLSVVSDRPDTLDLMRRNIADLGAELKQMGYENVDFNFSQSNGDKQFKQNQPDTDKNAAVLSEEIGDPASSRTVLAGIDMRV